MQLPTIFRLLGLLYLSVVLGCVRSGEDSTPTPPIETTVEAAAPIGDLLPNFAGSSPQPGGVLRVAMEAEPSTLNYQLDPMDGWGKRIGGLIFDSLARPSAKTFKHEPRLATDWTISGDGKTLLFNLRQGVQWHDTKPFSADDVVFTFQTLLKPES
ncbi:uncharacterized protein METZ01_LOCUS423173, partial [marine metagenome]